jgi:hypothetical protein
MHLARLSVLALALSLAMPAAAPAAAPPPPGPLTVSARESFTVAAVIEGQTVRLRVDPAVGVIVLNPGVAARLGLKPNFLNAIMKPQMGIGPERVKGLAGGGRIAIGSWTGKRPMFWFERDVVDDADGVIGIAHLPHDQVTMQVRPAAAGDASFVYDVEIDNLLGLLHDYQIGGKKIVTRFSLHEPHTQASASAGAVFAEQRGGTWAGEAMPRPIVFGVLRPTRPMAFATPISVNGMIFDRLLIRTSDYRGGYLLPTDPPADPNEIVVTGNKARGKAHLRLTISEDRLSSCASISYAKKEGRLVLICPAAQPGPGAS